MIGSMSSRFSIECIGSELNLARAACLARRSPGRGPACNCLTLRDGRPRYRRAYAVTCGRGGRVAEGGGLLMCWVPSRTVLSHPSKARFLRILTTLLHR
jgi:hypothetical protein